MLHSMTKRSARPDRGAQRLTLEKVPVGTRITMTAGLGNDAYIYTFDVATQGARPVGALTQTAPDGSVVGPADAQIAGSGNWTTVDNNPMLRGDWFSGTPYRTEGLAMQWGELVVGCEVVIQEAGATRQQNFLRLQPELAAFALTNM